VKGAGNDGAGMHSALMSETTAKATEPTTLSADVLIVGGGLVGLTLGLSLDQAGMSAIVVDTLDPGTALAADFDGRCSWIAPASRRVLDRLGVWAGVAPHAEPITDILVTDADGPRRKPSPFQLGFGHEEMGDEPLGHMVENRHVRIAQQHVVEKAERMHLLAPAFADDVTIGTHDVGAQIRGGPKVKAKVLIAADGKASRLRAQMGIKTVGWDYAQKVIVATVEHQFPHGGVAHEHFLPSGSFAVLPIQGNCSNLAWTEKADLAQHFLDLPPADFEAEVEARFGRPLGRVKLVGPRFAYPVSMQLARDYVRERFALVGDSAHAIHPLLGQGFNLGVRDVAALAQTLVEAKRTGLDIGGLDVLKGYERWRRFDNTLYAAATDGLNRLYANDITPLRHLRDLGMSVVGAIGPARRFFMREADGAESLLGLFMKGTGSSEVPRLLRGEAI